jgi:hypothetical protein
MNEDLHLIAGNFFNFELPKDKQYLFKYFKTDIQRQFVCYYTTFETIDNFTQHTGHISTRRWLRGLKGKLLKILELHKKSKEDMDFDTLAQIESGKYKF